MSKNIKHLAKIAKEIASKQFTENMRDIIYSKSKISKDQFAELKKVIKPDLECATQDRPGAPIPVPGYPVEEPNDSAKAYAGFKERAQELADNKRKSPRELSEFKNIIKPS
ncbi:uncharacterized protein LOC119688445 [Teleopsis dalmanni]|uniref:uncharacterized protein LOC119688445 n=1 Tax=Teleopsis dalmanni TaxID=139649 RepID=UPI0018CF3D74|nr:uncharacterized protein LOC119688445 [Teleopsis dalmanni]